MFNLFSTKPDPVISQMFQRSKSQLVILEQFKPLNDHGKFEAFIFTAYLLLTNPDISPKVQNQYLRHLKNVRKDYNVSLSSGDTVDLIDNRMIFYEDEFNKIFNSTGYMNTRIYNLLYNEPLCNEPSQDADLMEIMGFYSVFNSVTTNLYFNRWVSD